MAPQPGQVIPDALVLQLPDPRSTRSSLRSEKATLLSLPGELRWTIYELVFKGAYIRGDADCCEEHPLLTVCKSIRQEAVVLFYSMAIFVTIDQPKECGRATENVREHLQRLQVLPGAQLALPAVLKSLNSLHIQDPDWLVSNRWKIPYDFNREELIDFVQVSVFGPSNRPWLHPSPDGAVTLSMEYKLQRRHGLNVRVLYDLTRVIVMEMEYIKQPVDQSYNWTVDRDCGICSTRSIMWFLVRIRWVSLLRKRSPEDETVTQLMEVGMND